MRLSFWKQFAFATAVIAFLPVLLIAALLPLRRGLLVWGSSPMIANKYWSAAMREVGFDSMTIMESVQRFDSRDDFDRSFEDFSSPFLPRRFRFVVGACLALLFVLRRCKVLHCGCFGFVLGYTPLWRLEAPLLKLAGVKIVVIPFGADAYVHSRIIDMSLLYGLLASRPEWVRVEYKTARRVEYWKRHADVLIAGLMVDGIGRWDVTTNQSCVIDTGGWESKTNHNDNNGHSGPVKILHAPSYRGFKGTEFVIEAVEILKAEGLNIELILLENVPNQHVKQVMRSADILAEQFLAIGYGTNGVEGLASGLPVMANLDHEAYTRVFRRFAFLDECPILSTTPESMVDNLRILVENPALRRQLGAASRAYAEKYHSYATAQYMFGAIYDKLLNGTEIDLMNLFHPLLSEYNRRLPRVDHPLIENKLPDSLLPRNGASGRSSSTERGRSRHDSFASRRRSH